MRHRANIPPQAGPPGDCGNKIGNSLRLFLQTYRAERNPWLRLFRECGALDLLKAEKWFEPDSQNNIAQKFLELLDKDQEWVYVQLHLRGHS
jgi:hypothetical protein